MPCFFDGESHQRKAANHIREKRKSRITIFRRCDSPFFSDVICRFSLMRFASLFWRMASEKSGQSHKRKAANHMREKWRITHTTDNLRPKTDSGNGHALTRRTVSDRKRTLARESLRPNTDSNLRPKTDSGAGSLRPNTGSQDALPSPPLGPF